MQKQNREPTSSMSSTLGSEVGLWLPNASSEDIRFDYYYLKLFGGAVINTPMTLKNGVWTTVAKCQRDSFTINDSAVEYIWALEESDLPLFASREHYRAKLHNVDVALANGHPLNGKPIPEVATKHFQLRSSEF